MSDRPQVSIVMPTYDRLRFLRAAVESIFAQTLCDWELVVADDGSSDAPALEYLRALGRDPRVRVLRREHVGKPGKVRNAAIAEARAPLVAFMDSDDVWAPAKLEKQLVAMRARPECRWSYTAFSIVDADGVPFSSERHRRWTPYAGDVFTEVVRGTASIRTPAVVASTLLLTEIGGFDERIDCAEDYDLWARLALSSPVCVVDEPLVRVRRHRPDSAGAPGASHAGRDFSLRRLAATQNGPRRALVVEELGRNAWRHASVMGELRGPRQALATFADGLRFGWRHPRWWCGVAKAAARACVGPRGLPAPTSEPACARPSADTVETGLERGGEQVRARNR